MLSAYCVYVPIMGLNGITEAFLQATADTPRLATHSRWMVIFSVVYLAVCIIAFNGLGLGSVGFVVANCWNLSVRFWVSWLYITGFEREHATITDHPSQTNEKSNHEENERKKESEGHQLRRRKLHGGSARSEGDTPVSSHEGKNNTLMKLQSIVPAWQVTITFVLAGAIVRISESLFMYKNNSFQVSFKESAAHIAIGGVCAILAGASM